MTDVSTTDAALDLTPQQPALDEASTDPTPAGVDDPGPEGSDDTGPAGGGRDTLTVTDNRTGQTYELEITDEIGRAHV